MHACMTMVLYFTLPQLPRTLPAALGPEKELRNRYCTVWVVISFGDHFGFVCQKWLAVLMTVHWDSSLVWVLAAIGRLRQVVRDLLGQMW